MNKEKIKQELNTKHLGYEPIVDIVLDAIELSRQDEQTLIEGTRQIDHNDSTSGNAGYNSTITDHCDKGE